MAQDALVEGQFRLVVAHPAHIVGDDDGLEGELEKADRVDLLIVLRHDLLAGCDPGIVVLGPA
jgi:hypothetical protein